MNTGKRIRKLRERNGLRQKQLAEEVGTSAPNLSRVESGEQVPSADLVARIATFFHVSVDYLLGLTVHNKDVPDDVRGLSELIIETGYEGDLREFLLWVRAKQKGVVKDLKYDGVSDLLNLAPGLEENDLKSLLIFYDARLLRQMARLPSNRRRDLSETIRIFVSPYFEREPNGDNNSPSKGRGKE